MAFVEHCFGKFGNIFGSTLFHSIGSTDRSKDRSIHDFMFMNLSYTTLSLNKRRKEEGIRRNNGSA